MVGEEKWWSNAFFGSFLNKRLKKTDQAALSFGQAYWWRHLALTTLLLKRLSLLAVVPDSSRFVGSKQASVIFYRNSSKVPPFGLSALLQRNVFACGPLDLPIPYLALRPWLWHAGLFPFLWSQRWNEHWFGNLDSETALSLLFSFTPPFLKKSHTHIYVLFFIV